MSLFRRLTAAWHAFRFPADRADEREIRDLLLRAYVWTRYRDTPWAQRCRKVLRCQ